METKEQSKIQKLMKSKPAKAGVSVALVGTLALAGIGDYFTGTDTVENKFDISAGLTDKITVVEENWDTTDADTNGIRHSGCRRARRAPADHRQGPGREERVRC